MKSIAGVVVLISLVAIRVDASPTTVDLGGLVVAVSDSRTAQVFHVVDQLSGWDQFTHKQYVRWAAKSLPLTQEDNDLLSRHAALRRARGWGHGFEQAFYTDDTIDAAALRAIQAGVLKPDEAAAEATILKHFVPRLQPLLDASANEVAAFTGRLSREADTLKPLVGRICRFAEVKAPVTVPVFLVPNPEEGSGGGGANGGPIVIEIQRQPDPVPTLIHEALHAVIDPRRGDIQAAAESVGLTAEQLDEGIAYALSPGLTDQTASGDRLIDLWVRKLGQGATASDTFVRFYMVAAVIRPLLRSALDNGETLTTFLPRAAERWRAANR